MSGGQATAAEADKFIADAEQRLFDLNVKYARADWVKSTFITDDTEALSAEANKQVITAATELAEQSKRFDGLELSPDTARKIKLLKLALSYLRPRIPQSGTKSPSWPHHSKATTEKASIALTVSRGNAWASTSWARSWRPAATRKN